MQCEHCYYWRNLNQPDDLTLDQYRAPASSLGSLENLNLSGGEPFLRRELAEICHAFIRTNGVRRIYVPTNGYYTQRMRSAITEILSEPTLDEFVVELSLDGTAEFHDRFRVSPGSFDRAMETYAMLVELRARDERLKIHTTSTATADNLDELRALSEYLYRNCPEMEHHSLGLIRGNPKNGALRVPDLAAYRKLSQHIRALWSRREGSRQGSSVEPMLQWAKLEAVSRRRQPTLCTAGRLSAVVFANGDVGVCEEHPPIGNLRQSSFQEIWRSARARERRRSIDAKECFCTAEAFLWPSIVFRPLHLVKIAAASKAWRP